MDFNEDDLSFYESALDEFSTILELQLNALVRHKERVSKWEHFMRQFVDVHFLAAIGNRKLLHLMKSKYRENRMFVDLFLQRLLHSGFPLRADLNWRIARMCATRFRNDVRSSFAIYHCLIPDLQHLVREFIPPRPKVLTCCFGIFCAEVATCDCFETPFWQWQLHSPIRLKNCFAFAY